MWDLFDYREKIDKSDTNLIFGGEHLWYPEHLLERVRAIVVIVSVKYKSSLHNRADSKKKPTPNMSLKIQALKFPPPLFDH